MALIHLDHVPESVKVNLPLIILLPDPGRMGGLPLRRRKVLYLLHGLGDDASAWQRYTSIETVAASYGLVVVMPSVGRSFYIDQPNGQRYFTYLVEELPGYLADVFGLTPLREDTLIAGCSMGGYGAFKAAFLHPELYGAAASLSGLLSLEFLRAFPNDPRQAEFAHMLGDLGKLSGSEHDPQTWVRQALAGAAALPRLYMDVGRQEDLYPLNVNVAGALQGAGIKVNFHEEEAGHDWLFWDRAIRRFLQLELGHQTA